MWEPKNVISYVRGDHHVDKLFPNIYLRNIIYIKFSPENSPKNNIGGDQIHKLPLLVNTYLYKQCIIT